MSKHSDMLIERAEALGWTVHLDEDGWEFCQYSPAGEDFSFYVEEDVDTVAEAVAVFSTQFDVNEHVMLWIGSLGKRGVPGTVRELLEDAEAIGLMLHELGDGLLETEVEYARLMREEDAE